MISRDKIEEDLKRGRIRQGSLLKRSKFLKEWRKRWIVLTTNYLISFTNEKCQEVTDILDIRSIRSYKSYVSKCEEMIPASLKIRTGDTAFYLCASNVEEKWSWIVSIERLIDFRECGASAYNNMEFIKEKGFPSQHEYLDPTTTLEATLSVQKMQLQTAEKYKKNLELEAQILVKEINLEKEELQKEREMVSQLKNIRMSMVTTEPNGGPQPGIDFLQEVDRLSAANIVVGPKQTIMQGIFDQFIIESDQYFSFKYNIEYLVNMVSNERLGYRMIFDQLCKTHFNRLSFLKIMLETLGEYEPPILATDSGQNRTSAQVYSIAQLVKEMETFENWVKFIRIVLETHLKTDLTSSQKDQIASKLRSFLLADDSDSTDEVDLILDAILAMNQLRKYSQGELGARLEKLVKMSNRESISSKAKAILQAIK